MATTPSDAIRRWSAAIRKVEILEPWLTESGWDENYWDDVATLIVNEVGETPDADEALVGLASALRRTFPEALQESDNGFYLDNLERRLNLIVSTAIGQAATP